MNKELTLLNLYFDKKKIRRFAVTMDADKAKSMILFDFAQLEYHDEYNHFVLTKDEARNVITSFEEAIRELLHNKRELLLIFKKPLGYYQNKYYQSRDAKELPGAYLKNGKYFWSGGKYSLVPPCSEMPYSWMYTNSDNKIMLELSPSYPWLLTTSTPEEKATLFSEWMKSYQPHIITEISHEVVQEWLRQLKNLMIRIERSDKKYRCTGPGCEACIRAGKIGCPWCDGSAAHACPQKGLHDQAIPNPTKVPMPPALIKTIESIWKPSGIMLSATPIAEKESIEYGAFQLKLNHKPVLFRIAKRSYKTVGAFVSVWRRPTPGAKIIPYSSADGFEYLIVHTTNGIDQGQFIFPKKVLVDQGVFSDELKSKGKLGFRIYPPRNHPSNNKAMKEHLWQMDYYLPIDNRECDRQQLLTLLKL